MSDLYVCVNCVEECVATRGDIYACNRPLFRLVDAPLAKTVASFAPIRKAARGVEEAMKGAVWVCQVCEKGPCLTSSTADFRCPAETKHAIDRWELLGPTPLISHRNPGVVTVASLLASRME